MLRRMVIGVRISIAMIAMVVFIVGVILAFLYNSAKVQEISISEVQEIMLKGQKEKISVGSSSIARALGDILQGAPRDQAIETMRTALKKIRFEEDESGYYFIYEGTINIVHPIQPAMQGTDRGDSKDPNGKYYLRELYKAAQQGGGFVEYVYDKPGAGKQPKMAYAMPIPGTTFWIGTGVYIDNIEKEKARIAGNIDEIVSSNTRVIVIAIVVLLLGVIVPAVLFIIRSIVIPIKAATQAATDIAAGEYGVSLDESGRDEAAMLSRSLNAMAATLSANIEEITLKTQEAEEKAHAAEVAMEQAEEARKRANLARSEGMLQAAMRLETVVERISAATEEISSQSEEIRQGADVQKERIQTTATAMEEMNATVLEVAQNAGSAAERGAEAKNKAQHGAEVVGHSVKAMNTTYKQAELLKENMAQLDEQAQAIGNIMSVITDIADQTNLLALNAAIEAARAGEAGRGFAVVADEVRKLAEKTMGATKEVGDSIVAIQRVAEENVTSMEKALQDLEQAVDYSNQSGKVLNEIVQETESSAEQIQGIAAAAEEQSAASEEINRSIEEINIITTETARGVSESVIALQELAEQAEALKTLVQQLKEEGQAAG
ncbi:methyl-accepting chemotaxis protein [Desulfobaculum xiamenense]|uniref:Methyl-accepting chemotaxis protein n=1 Tax=Desulfobaculum xiamenense TaxID=995050 RepID=A0A846QL13_9BACT|nr:methyl-accepting chemotaxis protein [Desulfobaculum xiamenense]NJB68868.1 methyl-accepting chemotaxis protein [Desulfobaculum xiamenense]